MRNLTALLAALLVLPFGAMAQTVTVSGGGALTISGGATLDLNGGTLDFGGAGKTARLAETGGGRVADGTLTATRTLTSPDTENVAGLGFVVTSSADLGATTVTRGHAAQTGGGNTGIDRYYDVAPAQNNSGLVATVTFRYDHEELNGLDSSLLILFRSEESGSTWERIGGTADAAANRVTATGVDHFSRWILAGSEAALPVELTSFEGVADAGAVRLTWQTASETNNAGFVVEVRGGEDAWRRLAFVQGAGTTAEAQRYSYRAEGLAPGLHAFRLRQQDLDGTEEVSAEVEVEVLLLEP